VKTRIGIRRRNALGGVRMLEPGQLEEMIRPYGSLTGWETSRYNYGGSKPTGGGYCGVTVKTDVRLHLTPGYLPGNDRETRTDLYLQAESLLEVLRREKFVLTTLPVITIGGDDLYVSGCVELCLYMPEG
jgi:hypothetical protein